MVRRTQRSQTGHMLIEAVEGNSGARINSAERVRHQVHFILLLLREFFNLLGEQSPAVLIRVLR